LDRLQRSQRLLKVTQLNIRASLVISKLLVRLSGG